MLSINYVAPPRHLPAMWRDYGKWQFEWEIERGYPLLVQNLLTKLGKRVENLTWMDKRGLRHPMHNMENKNFELKSNRMTTLLFAKHDYRYGMVPM